MPVGYKGEKRERERERDRRDHLNSGEEEKNNNKNKRMGTKGVRVPVGSGQLRKLKRLINSTLSQY